MSFESVKLSDSQKLTAKNKKNSAERLSSIISSLSDNIDLEINKAVENTGGFEYKTLNLRDLDPEKMYPVYHRYDRGIGRAKPLGEVLISRWYGWDKDLNVDENGNNVPSSVRFSDGSDTYDHISSFTARIIGGDHPWGGASPHTVKVVYYDWKYMESIQLFDQHRCPVYIQASGDAVFTSDTSVKPTGGCPIYSGFYLRGGLTYRIAWNIGVELEPKLVTEPMKLYENAAYSRSEWLAPFDYKPENNMAVVPDIAGLA